MSSRVKSANGARRAGSSSGNRPSSSSNGSGNGNGNGNVERKLVGQYMLGKTIGEGTFGKVKLAVHIPTGEKASHPSLQHM